jgi:hypothetical protein
LAEQVKDRHKWKVCSAVEEEEEEEEEEGGEEGKEKEEEGVLLLPVQSLPNTTVHSVTLHRRLMSGGRRNPVKIPGSRKSGMRHGVSNIL